MTPHISASHLLSPSSPQGPSPQSRAGRVLAKVKAHAAAPARKRVLLVCELYRLNNAVHERPGDSAALGKREALVRQLREADRAVTTTMKALKAKRQALGWFAAHFRVDKADLQSADRKVRRGSILARHSNSLLTDDEKMLLAAFVASMADARHCVGRADTARVVGELLLVRQAALTGDNAADVPRLTRAEEAFLARPAADRTPSDKWFASWETQYVEQRLAKAQMQSQRRAAALTHGSVLAHFGRLWRALGDNGFLHQSGVHKNTIIKSREAGGRGVWEMIHSAQLASVLNRGALHFSRFCSHPALLPQAWRTFSRSTRCRA